MMKKILKVCLQVFVIVLLLFGCTGYLIYVNRAKIAGKLLDYTIQGMTGEVADNSNSGNWLSAFMDSDGVKNTMLQAVAERGITNKGKVVRHTQKLATIADMLINGTDDGEIDTNKMAQALVDSFGNHNNISVPAAQSAVYDINARDEKGRTLLMNVCRVDVSPKVIKMMLRYGADINAQDSNGRTALMYAAAFNANPEVINLLLERGAKVGMRDNKGKTAYDYAKDDNIADLLER